MTDDALKRRIERKVRETFERLDAPGALDAGRNRNGTFHLGRTMEALTRGVLSSEEIMWTAQRMQALVRSGATPDEAKAIVAEEARSRPWEPRQ